VASRAAQSKARLKATGEAPITVFSKPDHGLNVMPFGKHKGELFMDIPPYDLRSTFRWINDDPGRASKFHELADAIQQFLNQA
jgi:hypothetical protein